MDIRTVQRWLAEAEGRPPKKHQRDKYTAVDIAHLERVARVAQKLADANPDNPEYEPIRRAISEKPDARVYVNAVGSYTDKGNAVDGKHYLLTPEEIKAQLKAEFGEIFDPCPHPRPEGFDGLEVEWGPVNYVNPLFHQVVENGRTIGISMWIKKALEEQAKGKTSVLVYPQYSWFHLLLNAGAEMRSLGQVKWLATEDGTPQKEALPIVMFVLRGKKTEDL